MVVMWYFIENSKIHCMQMKLIYLTIVAISSFLAQGVTIADELIHYDNRGRTLSKYNCDSVSAHESSQQDTLVCTRNKQRATVNSINLKPIHSTEQAKRCERDNNCVVIDNQHDPHWVPIALRGIPNATFGLTPQPHLTKSAVPDPDIPHLNLRIWN